MYAASTFTVGAAAGASWMTDFAQAWVWVGLAVGRSSRPRRPCAGSRSCGQRRRQQLLREREHRVGPGRGGGGETAVGVEQQRARRAGGAGRPADGEAGVERDGRVQADRARRLFLAAGDDDQPRPARASRSSSASRSPPMRSQKPQPGSQNSSSAGAPARSAVRTVPPASDGSSNAGSGSPAARARGSPGSSGADAVAVVWATSVRIASAPPTGPAAIVPSGEISSALGVPATPYASAASPRPTTATASTSVSSRCQPATSGSSALHGPQAGSEKTSSSGSRFVEQLVQLHLLAGEVGQRDIGGGDAAAGPAALAADAARRARGEPPSSASTVSSRSSRRPF